MQALYRDKIKSNCFLLSISKPYSRKAVITAHNDRAVASGGKGGGGAKPANNFFKTPKLKAMLRADSFLSSFSELESR